MVVQGEVLLFHRIVFAPQSALRQATMVVFRLHRAPFRSIYTDLVVDALLGRQLLVCRALSAVHLLEPSTDHHGRVTIPLAH